MALSVEHTQPCQISVQQQLSNDIVEAVNSTREGPDQLSDQFLPKTELTRILSKESLFKLYAELFDAQDEGRESNESATTRSSLESSTTGDSRKPNATNPGILEAYVEKTLETSRTWLLALFLYDQRHRCLDLFKEWLSGNKPDLPTDSDLPLSGEQIENVFQASDHQYIINHQAVFVPFTIQEAQHQDLPFSRCRKPFIGSPVPIGKGGSGAVFRVKIAAGHWAYEKYYNTETEKDIEVAMKVFEERPNQAVESATRDFNNEKMVLDELQSMNLRHLMILLDLGSVTEKDEGGSEIRHMLFYDLAKCDLEEFFIDKDRVYENRYTVKSFLLSKGVDVLEAFAFLHEKFKGLHLDIKLDNIVVFEDARTRKGSQSSAASGMDMELTWKITDFNLSMKKINRTGTQSWFKVSSLDSRESTVPSPREAGEFQAPEIQKRKDDASEGSDVWSMGGILLFLLAFVHEGHEGVKHLYEQLQVQFREQGGRSRLFYVVKSAAKGESTYEWEGAELEYLDNFRPDTGTIKEGFEAAINPGVLKWSNSLHGDADGSEQECLRRAFAVIFKSVLVIDRKKRLSATQLHREFAKVRNCYKEVEQGSAPNDNPPEAMTGNRPDEITPPVGESPCDHSALCTAIMNKEDKTIGRLVENPENANTMCPRCAEYPIHKILKVQSDPTRDKALRALLKPPSTIDINLRCPDSCLTPIERACEAPGDAQALQLLFHFFPHITITKEFRNEHKHSLNHLAKRLIEEAYQRSKKDQSKRQASASTSGS
ncbi:hypothetical protein N0V83_002528 [Neocucurbitaria cava]|uniref:Protein kinase domain-containing protein n=1 Tax=Neocucurbitaria cava TaxID=798079 RepID=A0A9W9CPQ1_9PLEO|nr:hypothetical protein N0V83_002528 [Neocucurbitaria cava]